MVCLWRSIAEKNVLFCKYCHTDLRHVTRVEPVWSAFGDLNSRYSNAGADHLFLFYGISCNNDK
jgi:hypothetical protein